MTTLPRSTTSPAAEMPPLKPSEVELLISRAREARDQAYAPHSHFYVGAAVLTAENTVEIGCNVENASYGLTLCAERTAASAAIAAGHRQWRAIAIASVGGVTPCGACRQFLAEFGMNLTVISVDVISGNYKTYGLSKLLPEAFSSKHL